MKYTIDSSFFVALFYSNDINHERAKNLLIKKELLKKDILINNFIIEEVSTVLTYKGGKELANNFLSAIDVFNIYYSSTNINKYINFFQSIGNKISFADIAILYDALFYKTELITFDKQQESLYKHHIN